MKAYSVDLREKVLRAVDQGYPAEEIVKLLGVSRAVLATCGICPSDEAFENTLQCFSHLADYPDVG
jgi:hypothetical protein